MKTRDLALLVVLAAGLAGTPAAGIEYLISPDVPTDSPSVPSIVFLGEDVVLVDTSAGTYTVVHSFPPGTPVDALHQRCDGDWLFSVEAPTRLGGADYEPRDVIRETTAGTYSAFFCGGAVGVPSGVAVDSAYLVGGDNGNLVLGFDVPADLTPIGGAVYEPGDFVEFRRTGAGCAGWTLVGLRVDVSATTPPVPITGNITGSTEPGWALFTFDVPTTIGVTTYLPGEVAYYDGVTFGKVHSNPAWRISSRYDALSFLADPGRVPWLPPNKIHLTKAGASITVLWSASPSPGARDYGIYEGTLGSWYGHGFVTCTDVGGDFSETFVPQAASSYYLVVPLNGNVEGSYGTRSNGNQRPPGSPACRPGQGLSCP